jgi:glycosyltransferase involved in cell wall biosynthesis
MFASDLIRGLNQKGLRQHVAVLHGSGPLAVQYEAPTGLLRCDGWTVPGMRMDGLGVARLRRLVGRVRPTLVHAQGEALIYSILANVGRDIAILYRRIGTAPDGIARGFQRLVHGGLMRRSTRIVAVAEAVRNETIEMFGVPAERIVTIPRAIDTTRLEPVAGREATRRDLGIPPGVPVVLSLGALTWEKDPIAHIRVMARVISDSPETRHVVAGDGPLKDQVESTVADLGLHDRVILVGNRPDVGDLLAAADVMLLASRIEGMPGCLIEAGMAGLPSVAYAVAGVPEIVMDGTTGRVLPRGDIQGLATAVSHLLRDAPRRAQMGAAARARCRSLFDIGPVTQQYLELYQEMAS